jgi:hypothetical protein
MPQPPIERLLSQVRYDGGCWTFTGPARNQYGYGGVGKRLAHRLSYEALVGPVPAGLDLDHLCRNRRCVNPLHLEPVTRKENLRRGESGEAGAEFQRRKTHCPHGHSLAPGNLDAWSLKVGKRNCLTCRRARHTARRR